MVVVLSKIGIRLMPTSNYLKEKSFPYQANMKKIV